MTAPLPARETGPRGDPSSARTQSQRSRSQVFNFHLNHSIRGTIHVNN